MSKTFFCIAIVTVLSSIINIGYTQTNDSAAIDTSLPCVTEGGGSERTPSPAELLPSVSSSAGSNRVAVISTTTQGSFFVFPNPSQGIVTIKNCFKLIGVTDISGLEQTRNVVVTPFKTGLTISLNRLPKGVYVLKWMDQQSKVHSCKLNLY